MVEEQTKKHTSSNKKSSSKQGFLLGVVFALLIIMGLLLFIILNDRNQNMGGQNNTSPTTQEAANPNVDISQVDTKGEPYIGNANAPVTLAYWFDYQCPFCKKFETDTLPELKSKYIDTGKLKVVFKDFQFLGPDSQTAGAAAEAVWELYPNRFWDWQTAMFNAQGEENSGYDSKDNIIKLTRTVSGINADKVSSLMDQKKSAIQAELDGDKSEGEKFGIQSTPAFIIGNQLINGAEPTSTFEQAIDNELNNKK